MVCEVITEDDVVYNEKPVEVDYDVPPVTVNVNTVPTLEEAVADYQCGCSEAFDYLYRYYSSKFDYNAVRYGDEDVKQELGIVLYRCSMKYRSGGSSSFNTFFWTCAQNHIGMYLNKKRSKKRCCEHGVISLNLTAYKDSSDELTDMVADTAAVESFDDMLINQVMETRIYTQLGPKDEFIVRQLAAGVPVSAISKKLGITSPGVYVRLKKMKQRPEVSERLDELYQLLHA